MQSSMRRIPVGVVAECGPAGARKSRSHTRRNSESSAAECGQGATKDSCVGRNSRGSSADGVASPERLGQRRDVADLWLVVLPTGAVALIILYTLFGLKALQVSMAALSDLMLLALDPVVALVIVVLGLAALLAVAAVKEALLRPKLAAHTTGREVLRTLLQLVGDILLIPFYACMPKEKPMVGYQSTPKNLRILASCPSLEAFGQTPWAQNALWAFAALMVADNVGIGKVVKGIRREFVTAPDGGVVALDWWGEKDSKLVAKPKGVLFVNSTFTGDATPYCVRTPCKEFASRGWRCVVFVKRGCGNVMRNAQPPAGGPSKPVPWCLSDFEDVKLAIDHVARECPGVPICGLGLSTGAGQLRNYVNTTGKDSKLAAAVLLDAAPDWGSAIESCDKRVPLISQALGMCMADSFKASGYALPTAPSEASSTVVPGGLYQFIIDIQAPAHGFEQSIEGARQYMRACQPKHASNCAVPVLELVTTNDTVTTEDAAHVVQCTYKTSPHVVTALTRQGTHMVRWEGWWPRCWVTRVTGEFLEAAVQQLQAPPADCTAKPAKAAPTLATDLCGVGRKARARNSSFST